jgi:hypothetical protein
VGIDVAELEVGFVLELSLEGDEEVYDFSL